MKNFTGFACNKVNKSDFICCSCINARSLKNKFSELHELLYGGSEAYDIVCITESWLNSTVSDSMLDPNNEYIIFRKDRVNKKKGGGVCVFIRRHLHVVRLDLLDCFNNLECVCFDILLQASTIRVLAVYRPGGSSANDNLVMQMLINCLHNYCTTDITALLLGDLNCNNINWTELTVKNDTLQKMFLDATIDLGLSQYVEEPTRGENILDIVLCNDPLLISEVNVGPPFSISDHNSVDFLLCLGSVTKITNRSCFNDLKHEKVSAKLVVKNERTQKSAVLWNRQIGTVWNIFYKM